MKDTNYTSTETEINEETKERKHYDSVSDMLTEEEKKSKVPVLTEEEIIKKVFGWDRN